MKITQAIHTKYISSTDRKGSRIKATCFAQSLTVPYNHELETDENHCAAARALCDKLAKDERKIASMRHTLPEDWCSIWDRELVSGCLHDGSFAHILAPIV